MVLYTDSVLRDKTDTLSNVRSINGNNFHTWNKPFNIYLLQGIKLFLIHSENHSPIEHIPVILVKVWPARLGRRGFEPYAVLIVAFLRGYDRGDLDRRGFERFR